jgi:hypothetical protein
MTTIPTQTINGHPGTRPPRPLPTRARRPGLIAAAVLLVVGFALVGALLVSRAGHTTEVLVVAGPVPAGHVIEPGDVQAVRLSGSVRAIAVSDLGSVVGQTAAVDLVGGQLLNRDMLTAAAVPAPGQSMIGLALKPGQLPYGLAVGDTVQAIVIPAGLEVAAQDGPRPRLLTQGQVFAVRQDATTGGDTLVTLLVPADPAAQLAATGAAGRVGLIKIANPAVAR